MRPSMVATGINEVASLDPATRKARLQLLKECAGVMFFNGGDSVNSFLNVEFLGLLTADLDCRHSSNAGDGHGTPSYCAEESASRAGWRH